MLIKSDLKYKPNHFTDKVRVKIILQNTELAPKEKEFIEIYSQMSK